MSVLSIPEIHRLRSVADPSADALVERIAATGIIREVNTALAGWDRNDQPPPESLPDFVRDWLTAHAVLPEWADPALLNDAHALFRRHGPMIGLVGLTASFAWMYACPYGAKIMAHSGRFNDQTSKRIAETIHYILSVAEPGGFEPTGRGICNSTKVRLIHAIVRWFVRNRGGEPTPGRVPISQIEIISTAQALGPKLIDDVRKLQVRITPREAEAWTHLWRVCGTLLGGDPANFPNDYAAALTQVNRVLEEEKGPSEDGQLLIRQLLNYFAELIPGRAFDGIPAGLIRYLLDDERSAFIGVPASRWATVFRSGWVGGTWSFGKALPVFSSKTLERLALSVIEAQFKEVDGEPVRLELPHGLRTTFQRRAMDVIEMHADALEDGVVDAEEQATLAELKAQLALSDQQMRGMALMGAVHLALRDGVVDAREAALIDDYAQQAGLDADQRAELRSAVADGELDARERAWLKDVLALVG